jgi:uncharacterized protein YerC
MARGKSNVVFSSDDSDDGCDGEGKPSLDELAHAVQFFEDICTKQKAQLKTLKSNFLALKMIINLNCELTTQIEQLESKAPSSTTNDSLVKKNEKLKAKLASSQDAIENFLDKMEILSIHNNELTSKLESIGSSPGASLFEISEIFKNDASTFCFDLIDDSNPHNQVIVKNVVIETCSDEVALENELLKQEVARLCKVLYDKKGKAKQTQPP